MSNAYSSKVKELSKTYKDLDKEKNANWGRVDRSGLFERWNEVNKTNY
jgi:hypothetical protein